MFDPLGMASSYFQVPVAAEGRLTTNYGVLGGIDVPIDRPANSVFLDAPAFAFGGAGLVGTPADYDRFLAMIANGGSIGSKRIMSERAIALGTSNLLGADVATTGTRIAGAGFGAGGRVGLGADEGTFGWAGAAGTVGFVNRRIGLRAGFYVQFMPPDAYPTQDEFIAAVRGDLQARFPS